MGNKQSTFTDTVGIGGRESETSSPDCFMIEPVPEGLENVVYPKYEQAFRLGLEAFSNPMRVNKFKRPLPHILGTIEFQKQPHAGIVPTSKLSCSSEIPTPRNSPFSGPSSAAAQMSSEQLEDYFPGPSTSRVPFEDEEEHVPLEDQEVSDMEHSSHHSADSVVSPLPKDVLEPSSSISQFDGGLFEADYAMSNALEIYRQTEDTLRKMTTTDEKPASSSLFSEPSLTSIRRQRSNSRSPSEMSQMTKDLMQLGKNLSDLQSQRAAGNKANSKA